MNHPYMTRLQSKAISDYDTKMDHLDLLYRNAYASNTTLQHVRAFTEVFKFLEIFQPWKVNTVHREGIQEVIDSLLDRITVELEEILRNPDPEKEEALLELESAIQEVDNIMNM